MHIAASLRSYTSTYVSLQRMRMFPAADHKRTWHVRHHSQKAAPEHLRMHVNTEHRPTTVCATTHYRRLYVTINSAARLLHTEADAEVKHIRTVMDRTEQYPLQSS